MNPFSFLTIIPIGMIVSTYIKDWITRKRDEINQQNISREITNRAETVYDYYIKTETLPKENEYQDQYGNWCIRPHVTVDMDEMKHSVWTGQCVVHGGYTNTFSCVVPIPSSYTNLLMCGVPYPYFDEYSNEKLSEYKHKYNRCHIEDMKEKLRRDYAEKIERGETNDSEFLHLRNSIIKQ